MSATKLQDAMEALEAAKAAFEEAEKRASYAQGEEISALNRLNNAQKQFDALVQAIREDAPRRTDWKRERERMEAVDV